MILSDLKHKTTQLSDTAFHSQIDLTDFERKDKRQDKTIFLEFFVRSEI